MRDWARGPKSYRDASGNGFGGGVRSTRDGAVDIRMKRRRTAKSAVIPTAIPPMIVTRECLRSPVVSSATSFNTSRACSDDIANLSYGNGRLDFRSEGR